jgi:uncharacterized protein YkwD
MSFLSPPPEPSGDPPRRPAEWGTDRLPASATIWLPPGSPQHSRGDGSPLWRAARIVGFCALALVLVTVPVAWALRGAPPMQAEGGVVATPSSALDAARAAPSARPGASSPARASAAPGATAGATPAPILGAPSEPDLDAVDPQAPAAEQSPTGMPTVRVAPPPTAEALSEQIVVLTNDTRTANGLPALTVSACATQQATARTAVLVTEDRFEHDPLGPIIAQCDSGTVGENLSRGYADAQATVDGWMASPGHRANILNPAYTRIGVGCTNGPQGELCGQVFLG